MPGMAFHCFSSHCISPCRLTVHVPVGTYYSAHGRQLRSSPQRGWPGPLGKLVTQSNALCKRQSTSRSLAGAGLKETSTCTAEHEGPHLILSARARRSRSRKCQRHLSRWRISAKAIFQRTAPKGFHLDHGLQWPGRCIKGRPLHQPLRSCVLR